MNEHKGLDTGIRYRLLRKIAEGGMGVVYEGLQEGVDEFSKMVAIKIIREEFSAIREFRDNFIGEARLVADLIHTNIVQTYHLGSFGNQYFMVMEFVNGVNLEEFVYQHRYLGREIPVDLAAFIVSRICRGLSYAHTKRDRKGHLLGIVHRDVNPRNIMLGFEGDVKLTDFGIAKALNLMYNVEGEVIAGKDEYLSPEQARREITDGRADLFSCGIVLLELLLGENFFEEEDPLESRHNILEKPIPPIGELRKDVDEGLDAIVHKALMRNRDDRYQTAADLMTALELYLYSDGYGPTNEKLSAYLMELYREGNFHPERQTDTSDSFGLAGLTPV
jgi:eukaryotic-like serine/threonine-protein kinase